MKKLLNNAVAVIVVMIVLLLIIPLNPFVLDVFIILNKCTPHSRYFSDELGV